MAVSLLSRKRDILYALFFVIHIAAMLAVDLAPLYPSAVRPAALDRLRAHYIENYQDRFFTDPPAWFGVYVWIEAGFHLPVSVWAVRALVADDPKVPVWLLVFAVVTAVTTLTCVAEALSWDHLDQAGKLKLVGGLYAPYLALAVFMGVDMVRRLEARVSRAMQLESEGTSKDRKGSKTL